MFQTIVLVICAFYAFLIVYAYIPSEVIPLDELKSPDDRFFYHSEHRVRYQLLSEFSSEKSQSDSYPWFWKQSWDMG